MNKQFISLIDVDGNMHTLNINCITRVSWAEERDDLVDMIYLAEGNELAEIALEPQSDQSKLLMAGLTAGVTNHGKVINYLNPKPNNDD